MAGLKLVFNHYDLMIQAFSVRTLYFQSMKTMLGSETSLPNKMAENLSGKVMSISFTLPISCQICLGKVKQPIVCPNQHVFCKSCIDLWLKHNQQCPTCRVPITPENPCKQVIGGHSQENGSDFSMSDPALRRARFDVLYQDCENEIKRLQEENETLGQSNSQLRQRLADAEGAHASQSEEISQYSSPNAKTQNRINPRSSPSVVKLKGKSQQGTDTLPQEGSKHERRGMQSSSDGVCDDSGQMLAVLRSKLKQATSMYEKIKEDMNKLKEKNTKLSDHNRNLLLENGRLKQSTATRSPHKYEKYASMAQQAQLEECRREVTQLKSALDRSDNYIEELETELEDYRSRYGSLPRKRRCHGDETKIKTSKASVDSLPGVLSTKCELAFGKINNKTSETSKLGRTVVSSSTSSPRRYLNCHKPLLDGNDEFVDNLSRDKPLPRSGFGVGNSEVRKLKEQSVEDAKGSQEFVTSACKADAPKEDALRHSCISASDLQSEEQTRPVRTTPSAALRRLSLDSAQKPQKPPSLLDSFSSSPGLEFNGLQQSCHRQIDFGKEHPETSLLWSTLDTSVTQGLMVGGNEMDAGPLDQNATFSDLNFTLTSEIFDCAQFMKEAEKRLKNKHLFQHDKDVFVKARFPSVEEKSEGELNASDQKGEKRMSPGLGDKEPFQYFAPVTTRQAKENGSHAAYGEGRELSGGHRNNYLKSNLDTGNRYVERSSCGDLKESVANRLGTGTVVGSGSVKTCHTSIFTSSDVPSTSTMPESSLATSFQIDSIKGTLSHARQYAAALREDDRTTETGVKTSTNRDREGLSSHDKEVIVAKARNRDLERPTSSVATHYAVSGTTSSSSFFSLPRRIEVKQIVFEESRKKIRSDRGSDDDDD